MDMENIKNNIGENLYIVSSCGELFGTIHDGDQVKIYSKDDLNVKKKAFKKKNQLIPFKRGEYFIKFFQKPMRQLVDELSNSDIGFMMKLINLITCGDNILRRDGSIYGEILNQKDIVDCINDNSSNCNRHIKNLENHNILKRIYCVDKCIYGYIFNPYICVKGQEINAFVLDLFSNSTYESQQK